MKNDNERIIGSRLDRAGNSRYRTRLRLLASADGAAVIKLAKASRALHQPWVSPPTTGEMYERYFKRLRRPDSLGYAVVSKTTDTVVGVLALTNIVRGNFQCAFVSYYVDATFSQQGYMTEALEQLVRRAFTSLRLHRLEANIQPGNHASKRLAARAGFCREGFSPKYLKIRNRWCDHERWAIRADQWKGRRRG